jgi:hypothetical protein
MNQNTFSIASILLLTIVVAVVASALGNAARTGRLPPEAMAGCVAFGAPFGLIVGIAIGLAQPRRGLGALLGAAAGLAAGTAGTALMFVPGTGVHVLVGSAIMIAFGAAVRWFSR